MILSARAHVPSILAATMAFAVALTVTSAAKPSPQKVSPKIVPTVAVAVLQRLLPTVAGWTKGGVTAERAIVSETCSYAFAYAPYTNAGATVRVTVADTGFDPGGLGTLATMVTTFPNGYSGQIPPATTVNRLLFKGSPAAALWDSQTGEGEFTVVVDGRFVAKAEGTHLENGDVPRTIVDAIDLKALAALK